jgi:hypothetical protein
MRDTTLALEIARGTRGPGITDHPPKGYTLLPAYCGEDVIRGEQWIPKTNNRQGWQRWADKEARKLTKRDRFPWTGVVAYIPARHAYRVSFAGMPSK